MVAEVLLADASNDRTICDVGQVDGYACDVISRRASSLEQGLDVSQRLSRLLCNVVAADKTA